MAKCRQTGTGDGCLTIGIPKMVGGEAEPSRERLVALVRTTGAGVAWLAEGAGLAPVFETVLRVRRRPIAQPPAAELDWNQFVLLPRHTNHTGANQMDGEPINATSTGSGFIALRQDWVRSVCDVEPRDLALETATGEAMAPTVPAGDILLIDTATPAFRNSGIYLLDVGGERLIRRVQRKHDGNLLLICDNPAYQADIVGSTESDTVTAIGRVVWVGGTVR